ncbi:MAG TPA: sigma-70 family RNA polymerase sigma factor [Candidatus Limnocylindrales bacterium]
MSELEVGPSLGADARTVAAASAELSLFVAEHYPRLIRLAGLICDQPADREDAVQTALERAWRARDSLHEPDRLRVWLDRIVVREAIRLTSRMRRVRVRLIEPRRVEDPAVGQPEIRDRRSNEPHEMVALRAAFDELPPSQRAVVVLHLYAGYSVQDTAELVDARVETVRSRLRLARARLRTLLESGES